MSLPRWIGRLCRPGSRLSMVKVQIVLCMAALAGCIPYPVYKKLQPAAHVSVTDQSNRPLESAEVILIASAYPYGVERGRASKRTDVNGVAEFEPNREWRIETIALHGAEIYFWNWCVRKEGYSTYLTAHRDSEEFEKHMTIQLPAGVSTPCPGFLE